MICRDGEAHFCKHAKNKVEKKWYERRVVHDDNNVVCLFVGWFVRKFRFIFQYY